MASENVHILQANRNQKLLDSLLADTDPFTDWIANVAFYKAVRIVASGIVRAVINAARTSRGLPALTLDDSLTSAAAGWAAWMAATGRLDHGDHALRMDAAAPGYEARGECIAYGYDDPAMCVAAWLASPAHSRIILGDYRRVGAGRARSTRGVVYDVVDVVR
jgi:uncharacterized protein YkwD